MTEFDHVGKGDAMYAMESLEKLTNEKLLHHHVTQQKLNFLLPVSVSIKFSMDKNIRSFLYPCFSSDLRLPLWLKRLMRCLLVRI
ncbi:Ferritin chloroplastic [Euphorbia peplus]|nr:Ferritin chloroplastic [Euphorbia peplus]